MASPRSIPLQARPVERLRLRLWLWLQLRFLSGTSGTSQIEFSHAPYAEDS
jgi:hypothetical protein